GVTITPLRPANCGFTVAWSEVFASRFAGMPLKSIGLAFDGVTVRGEALITNYGIEGGAVYALSASLREAIAADGAATLAIDLKPEFSAADIAAKLGRQRAGETLANTLRKALNLSPVAVNLLREAHGTPLAKDAAALSAQIKHVPLTLNGTTGLERAISTAGG